MVLIYSFNYSDVLLYFNKVAIKKSIGRKWDINPLIPSVALICCTNQLTGFYEGSTGIFNRVIFTYSNYIIPINQLNK